MEEKSNWRVELFLAIMLHFICFESYGRAMFEIIIPISSMLCIN